MPYRKVYRSLLTIGVAVILVTIFVVSAEAKLPIPFLTQLEWRYNCATPPQWTYNGGNNCGPASMAMVVQADGLREPGLTDIGWVHRMRLRMTGVADNGACQGFTTMAQMQTACNYYSMSCSQVQGWDGLQHTLGAGIPFIAYVNASLLYPRQYPEEWATAHFLVVTAQCDDGLLMQANDPLTDTGPVAYTISSFNDAFGAYGQWGLRAGKGLGAFFLPDVVYDPVGWQSQIVVQNNTAVAGVHADVQFRDSDGNYLFSLCRTLGARGSATIVPSYGPNVNGPAIVDASGDVSVVVVNDNGSKAYAYTGVPTSPAVSGIGTGTGIFLPSYLRNYYGWYSDLYVQNTSATAATVYATFYNDSGTPQQPCQSQVVDPNGQAFFGTSGSYTTIGSVYLTATLPIAVVVRHGREDLMAYEGFSSGGSVGYLPSLLKSYYGWTSSYETQEVAGTYTSVAVTYYPGGPLTSFNLQSRGHQSTFMSGVGGLSIPWRGSAKVVTSPSGRKVATAVHHANATGGLGYHGAKAGARDLFMPILKRGVGGWDASLTVQNVGTSQAQVTVRFYNTNGNEQTGERIGPFALNAGYSRELYSELPSGVTRAVWVHSEAADVIAAMHETQTGGRAWGYSVP